MARGNKNGTVLGLIVICEKKGTIKYSNKIDKRCQIAELCEFDARRVHLHYEQYGSSPSLGILFNENVSH